MPTVRQVQRTPRPDSLFAIRAQELLAEGESLQALELCRQGLIYYPHNPTGYVMLAYSYLALGETDRARNVLNDGFRRTGARPLRQLHQQLQSTPIPLPVVMPSEIDVDVAAGIPGGLDLRGVLDRLEQFESPGVTEDSVEISVSGDVREDVPEDYSDDVDLEIVAAIVPDAAMVTDIPEVVPDAVVDEIPAVVPEILPVVPVVEISGKVAVDEVAVDEVEPEPEPEVIADPPIVVKPTVQSPPIATTSPGKHDGSLALHMGRQNFRPRSSNLRLIPGLEFAPLRQEDTVGRQSIAGLMSEAMPEPMLPPRAHESEKTEDPQIVPMPLLEGMEPLDMVQPLFSQSKEPLSLADAIGRLGDAGLKIPFDITGEEDLPADIEEPKLTPLEKLARQLETARIPAVEEVSEQHAVFEPSMVTDTFANILVAQKAYAEAMKAFQMLARHKPERVDYYQARIHEMKEHLQSKPPEEDEADTSD